MNEITKRHFFKQTASFEPSCVQIDYSVLSVESDKKEGYCKVKYIKISFEVIFHPSVGPPQPTDSNLFGIGYIS
jgi:hypothetical protein